MEYNMTVIEKKKDEFKIDDDDNEKNRLETIRKTFFNLIWCEDGNSFSLFMIEDGQFILIDRMLTENRTLLKKDPLLYNMMNSVCARHYADCEPYFPTPDDLRKTFRRDFATGIILLFGCIVKSGIRLARQLGYTKRGFNKNMCDFLIGKGMMTSEEYASFQNLRKYSEEARSKLIMDPPPEEEIANCETLYERMVFELFRSQVGRKVITTPDD